MTYTTVFPRVDSHTLSEWLLRWIAELSLPVFSYDPTRGIQASLVARTACYGNGVNLTTSITGYRVSHSPSNFDQKMRDTYYRDRDIFVGIWEKESRGKDHVLLPILGPWSLAANLELANGHRVLEDKGARRDIIEANLHGLIQERKILADLLGIAESSVLFAIQEPEIVNIFHGNLRGQTALETIAAIPEDVIFRTWGACRKNWAENTLLALPGYEIVPLDLDVIFAPQKLPHKSREYDQLAAWLDRKRKIICPVPLKNPGHHAEHSAQDIITVFTRIGMQAELLKTIFAVTTKPQQECARYLDDILHYLL